jgi:hypothetical protein
VWSGARTCLSAQLNALSSFMLRSAKTPGGFPFGRRPHAAMLWRTAPHPARCDAAPAEGSANAARRTSSPAACRVSWPPAAATPSARTQHTGRTRGCIAERAHVQHLHLLHLPSSCTLRPDPLAPTSLLGFGPPKTVMGRLPVLQTSASFSCPCQDVLMGRSRLLQVYF